MADALNNLAPIPMMTGDLPLPGNSQPGPETCGRSWVINGRRRSRGDRVWLISGL
jgi:hypothetical protein